MGPAMKHPKHRSRRLAMSPPCGHPNVLLGRAFTPVCIDVLPPSLFIDQIAGVGEGEIGLTPLVPAFQAPVLRQRDRLQADAPDASEDEMGQPGSGIFHRLRVGRTAGMLRIVAPPGDPTPLSLGISLEALDPEHQPRRSDLLKPGKQRALAIGITLNLDKHGFGEITSYEFRDEFVSLSIPSTQSRLRWRGCRGGFRHGVTD